MEKAIYQLSNDEWESRVVPSCSLEVNVLRQAILADRFVYDSQFPDPLIALPFKRGGRLYCDPQWSPPANHALRGGRTFAERSVRTCRHVVQQKKLRMSRNSSLRGFVGTNLSPSPQSRSL